MERTEPIRFDRLTLYELVWSQPMTQLAQKFGLSDVGLAKICARLNVPRPSRGHWAKILHGKTPRRTPLPPPKAGQPTEAVIEPQPYDPASDPASPKNAREDVPEVKVPDQLRRPHPLVQAASAGMRGTDAVNTASAHAQLNGHLDFRVEAKALARALRIMDSLIKALEERGHEVQVRRERWHERWETVAVIRSEPIRFYMREGTTRVAVEPSAEEIRRAAKLGWSPPQTRYEYRPSGKLALEIDTYCARGFRKRWSDGRKRRLEDLLGRFIVGIEAVGAFELARRLEREEEDRRREEARRKAEEEAERKRIEEETVKELRQLTSDWREASEIRAFLAVVQEHAPATGNLRDWITWGLQVADRLDPIASLREDSTSP